MRPGHFQYRAGACRKAGQRGYALIVIMFMMTVLIIAALATAPRVIKQVQRDREEEMMHRGAQYARAIKKYYKKNGGYPASMQALDGTTTLRYLRKRYKDPFVENGEWRLVRFGEVQFTNAGGQPFANMGGSNPGIAAAQLAAASQLGASGQLGAAAAALGAAGGLASSPGGLGGAPSAFAPSGFGGQNQGISSPGGLGAPSGAFNNNNNATGGLGTTAAGVATATPAGSETTTGTTGSGTSSSSTSATAFGAQPVGGGAIIGVASTSGKQSVRLVDDKDHYKDWKFVYDPSLDRNGILINGPYSAKMAKIMATANANSGQQLGQPIGPNGIGNGNGNNSSFGQSGFNQNGFGQSGFGQSGQSGFGQQPSGSLGQGYAPPSQPVQSQ